MVLWTAGEDPAGSGDGFTLLDRLPCPFVSVPAIWLTEEGGPVSGGLKGFAITDPGGSAGTVLTVLSTFIACTDLVRHLATWMTLLGPLGTLKTQHRRL